MTDPATHASKLNEESLLLESPRGRLAAMLHTPTSGEAKAALAMCHPPLEERKNAYRCYVETARILAERGIACLRFDYFGTGDSPGDHAETDLQAHMDSIAAAAALLRRRWPDVLQGLLGLRLGATLAAQALADNAASADLLVLWEPVLSGKQLLSLERKRQKLREQLTRKEMADAGASLPEQPKAEQVPEDLIDMEGFALSQQFYDELEALRLPDALARIEHVKLLLLQISFRDEITPQTQRVAEPLREKPGIELTLEGVKMQPVWNRLDPFDWSAPGLSTAGWVETHVA